MGFSSQWNFGKNRHLCPASLINVSSIETWFVKSSCLLRSLAIQHASFSQGQTGEHFARILSTLNPHSCRVCSRPLGSPLAVVIDWGLPWSSTFGLFIGMMVFFCLRCLPPLPLFISKALRVSGGSEAWTDDWSKIKRAWHPGCASSKVGMTCVFTCVISCSQSQYLSPLAPG